MIENEQNKQENCLYHRIHNTLYEISVRQSENAKDSIEDILIRLIAADQNEYEEDSNGKETG